MAGGERGYRKEEKGGGDRIGDATGDDIISQ